MLARRPSRTPASVKQDDDRRRRLLEGPVGETLLSLTVPLALGIGAILFFNVVDTFWVGQLGAAELAAMGFTFPVAMIVTSLTMGIAIGGTAVIARACGSGHQERVRRLTTDALALSLMLVVVVSALGLMTIRPVFTALGANSETLPLIEQYMTPWYAGIGLLVVPMVGNGAIRGAGDVRTPSIILGLAGFGNAVFDPVLIFGWGPIPAMGLQGAALATIGSYAVAMVAALYVLVVREGMLSFRVPAASEVLESWRAILHIGIPAAGTQLLTPVAGAVVTRIVADQGQTAVAAYGVATRVESISMIGVFAMTAAITTFVGTNLGARKTARIQETLRFCVRAAFIWGLGAAAFLGLLAGPIAGLFNDDAAVVGMTALYFRTVPITYAGLSVALLVASMCNALNVPLKATLIAFVRLMLLAVPLAYVGSLLFDLWGVFLGIATANVLVGIVGYVVGSQHVRALHLEHSLVPPAPTELREAAE